MSNRKSTRSTEVPESDAARLALHDCPGCGTNHVLAAHTRDDGPVGWCVSCGRCGVVGPTGDSEATAAENWNAICGNAVAPVDRLFGQLEASAAQFRCGLFNNYAREAAKLAPQMPSEEFMQRFEAAWRGGER